MISGGSSPIPRGVFGLVQSQGEADSNQKAGAISDHQRYAVMAKKEIHILSHLRVGMSGQVADNLRKCHGKITVRIYAMR